MPTLLCIETATAVCSVALTRDSAVLALQESSYGFDHAEKLASFIESLVHDANVNLEDIDAVAVSGGPGSYTGLRIGVSTAKGICWSLDKPMIAVPTLTSMAAGVRQAFNAAAESRKVLFCPMIDARRMEVYTSLFDEQLNVVSPVSAALVDTAFCSSFLEDHIVYFFGDGMPKCKSLLDGHPNARFVDDFAISATHLIHPAEQACASGGFVHTALYEPFYFKEFVAGKGSVLPTAK